MTTDGGDGVLYSFPMKRPREIVDLLSYMNIQTSEQVRGNAHKFIAGHNIE